MFGRKQIMNMNLNNRILIITAVQAECSAVRRGLCNNPRFDVRAVGVGSAVAAVGTAKALALMKLLRLI
jgi:futalosine hydrolase